MVQTRSGVSGHSLRAGFVTSALHHGADILRVMDVTRHREVSTSSECSSQVCLWHIADYFSRPVSALGKVTTLVSKQTYSKCGLH